MLAYLVELFGVERIALGSDYPFPLGEQHPGRLIESLDSVTPDDRHRMLWGTAVEFLGIDEAAYRS
jgi:aminocarboxymuconate-semialdehyde decarboxylase